MKLKHPVGKALLLLLAAPMLPVSAFAKNEKTAVDASDISADMAETDSDRAMYLPDAGCYAVYENDRPSWADSDEYAISPNDGKIFADEDIVRIPCLTNGMRKNVNITRRNRMWIPRGHGLPIICCFPDRKLWNGVLPVKMFRIWLWSALLSPR